VKGHLPAITKLADAPHNNCIDIWKDTKNDGNLELLLSFCKAYILPRASSTHRLEACIREASHCASTGRSEEMRSAFVVQRSVAGSDIKHQVQAEACDRSLHANQHMSGEKKANAAYARKSLEGKIKTLTRKMRTP
jgi:hypothetical protein